MRYPLFHIIFQCGLGGVFFLALDFCLCLLVDHTTYKDCTICPLIVSTARGQYFAALEYVNPVHVENFPFLISLSYVYFTGNPDAACMYCTRDSTLGRS